MRKRLFIILFPFIVAFTIAGEGMYSVITSKEDALLNKKYKKFALLDEATGFVLGRKPIPFDASENIPLCYFTTHDLSILKESSRAIAIHSLSETNTDDYDWVLEHNQEEKAIFFARSNFIGNKNSMHWIFIVRNDRVLLKNFRSGQFLKLDKNGEFHPVENENQATKWKLIHKG